MSLLDRLDATNRRICETELVNHRKHYWCAIKWIERQVKKRRFPTVEAGISELFGTGSTVARAIFEEYSTLDREQT